MIPKRASAADTLRARGLRLTEPRRLILDVVRATDAHPSASTVFLRTIPGTRVNVVERCSAVDGTWGFKKEYYELSLKVAKPLFDAVSEGGPVTATDCPLAALQIGQGTGRNARHPIELLADAYGLTP